MTGVKVDQLKEGFAGEVVRPGDDEYDCLRAVFNGMIDRRPAAIARCTGVGDVVAAVNYTRARGLALAVYGGGHGVTGHAVCDDGLVIDLRPMKEVRIVLHSADCAPEVVRFFRDYMANAPDEVGGAAGLITAPPQPFVPASLRGRPVVAIIACYAGDVNEGARVLAPLREYGPPAADLLQRMPYTALQQLVDDANKPGLRNHWGGEFFLELSDEAIDVFCAAHATAPSLHTQLLIIPGGGQIARVPEGATAIGQRQAPWNTHMLTMWEHAADDARNLAYVNDVEDNVNVVQAIQQP